MAIAYVQGDSKAATTASSVTTDGITTTAGHSLIVVATAHQTGSPAGYTSITDSKGNTYSLAKSGVFGTLSCDIWYCSNIVGGAGHTLTANYPVSATLTLLVQDFSGLASTDSLDKTASATNVTSNASSGNTAATDTNDELIVGGVGVATVVPTLGAGFSNLLQISTGGGAPSMESKIVSSTGAYSADFVNNAASWICVVATFKAYSTTGGGFLLNFI